MDIYLDQDRIGEVADILGVETEPQNVWNNAEAVSVVLEYANEIAPCISDEDSPSYGLHYAVADEIMNRARKVLIGARWIHFQSGGMSKIGALMRAQGAK